MGPSTFEIDSYIAKCLFQCGQAKEALIVIGQVLEDFMRNVSQTSYISDKPRDIDTILTAIINKLKEEGQFVGPYKLASSQCMMSLCWISSVLGYDKQAVKYYNEAVRCNACIC